MSIAFPYRVRWFYDVDKYSTKDYAEVIKLKFFSWVTLGRGPHLKKLSSFHSHPWKWTRENAVEQAQLTLSLMIAMGICLRESSNLKWSKVQKYPLHFSQSVQKSEGQKSSFTTCAAKASTGMEVIFPQEPALCGRILTIWLTAFEMMRNWGTCWQLKAKLLWCHREVREGGGNGPREM